MANKRSSPSPTPSDHDDAGSSFSPDASPFPSKPTTAKAKRTPAKRSSSTDLPTTRKAKARKVSSTAPTSGSKPSNGKRGAAGAGAAEVDWSTVEGMTPEKKAGLINYLIGLGASGAGNAALAERFNVSATLMKNSIQAGRPGNLRDKAVKAVRGEN